MHSDSIDDLPDDLAALGQQLSDDAARLAACYPASSARMAATPQVRWPAWRRSAAAALLLAVGGGGWIIGRFTLPVESASRSATSVSRAAATPVADSFASLPPAHGAANVGAASSVRRADRSQIAIPDTDRLVPRATTIPRGAVATSRPVSFGSPGQSPDLGQTADGADDAPPRPPRDEAELLRMQIDAFTQVIERLQAELARRDEVQRETNKLIQSLTDEVARLRRQLDARSPDQPSLPPAGAATVE
jgi:hypothetical protein